MEKHDLPKPGEPAMSARNVEIRMQERGEAAPLRREAMA